MVTTIEPGSTIVLQPMSRSDRRRSIPGRDCSLAAPPYRLQVTNANLASTGVTSVSFSPDGARLLSRDGKGQALIWKLESGEVLPDRNVEEFPAGYESNITSDGRWLAIPSTRDVLLVDLNYQKTPRERQRRKLLARPRPRWHRKQFEAARSLKQWYVAVFHGLSQPARGWPLVAHKHPEPFLDHMRYFVLFEDDGDSLIRMFAGYHQLHGVREAVRVTTIAAADSDDGVVCKRRATYGDEVQLGDRNLKQPGTELTEKLRSSTTADCQVRDSVRAKPRDLVRRLLRRYKYSPDRTPETIEGNAAGRIIGIQPQLFTDWNGFGLKLWPRLWHNLKAGRQAELTDQFLAYVVSGTHRFGHTSSVSGSATVRAWLASTTCQ